MKAGAVNEADVRPCPECGGRMVRATPGRGRFPARCAECRAERVSGKRVEMVPARLLEAPADAPESPEAPESLDAIEVITSFGLDYLVGSAARYLLEYRDGDEAENLRQARIYLDRAIAAREA